VIEKVRYISSTGREAGVISKLETAIIQGALRRKLRPSKPFYLTWNITNECNLKCIYCSNNDEKTTVEVLCSSEVLKIASQIVISGIKYVRILGGEPTLLPAFPDAIDVLLGAGIYVSFSTNGVGVNDRLVHVLKKYSPHQYSVNVSIDSSNESVNERTRGAGSCDIAKRALSHLLDIEEINLTLFSVITKYNSNDLENTYEYCVDKGIPFFSATTALEKGLCTQDMVLQIDENTISTLYRLCKKAQTDSAMDKQVTKVNINLGYLAIDYICEDVLKTDNAENLEFSNLVFRAKCSTCITRLHLDSDGSVYPCDYLKFPDFLLGNVTKDSFLDIWQNDTADYISKIRRNDKVRCADCNVYTCSTGCMGLSYGAFGTLLSNDPNCKLL